MITIFHVCLALTVIAMIGLLCAVIVNKMLNDQLEEQRKKRIDQTVERLNKEQRKK